MGNKKGITLIEIIIALAILGVVAVITLTGFSNYFSMTISSQDITVESFETQREMELAIQEIKNDLKNNIEPTTSTKTSYTLFDGTTYKRNVDGYPLKKIIKNDRDYDTIVADLRMPEFKVATISDVEIDFYTSNTKIDNAYTTTNSINIKSKEPTINDPENVNLMNLHKWYVSRDGYNIPKIKNPEEIEIGSKYPAFPEDYVVIPNETTSSLNTILPSYAGKHILYTITPAAKSGKMGATVLSNELFMSGLNMIEDLILHLDASFISKESSDEVTIVDYSNIHSKKWRDISGSNNYATQSTQNKQPILNEVLYNSDKWGKSISGTTGTSMTTSKGISSNNMNEMTIIMAAKIKQNQTGKNNNYIINGGNWGLGWNDTGDIGFYRKKSNGYQIANQFKAPSSEWSIITGIIDGNKLSLKINNNESVSSDTSNQNKINKGPLTINLFPSLEIGEIIVYNKDISGTNLESVETYLNNKYNIPLEGVTINNLENISADVFIGEPYELPYYVNAIMSNGTKQSVTVTWKPAVADTSVAGTKTYIGTSINDPTKTVKLILNVLTISSLEDINIVVDNFDPFAMPTHIEATLSNGSKRQVPVTWNPGTISTDIVGTYISTGTTSIDIAKTSTLTLVVQAVPVTSVTLVNPDNDEVVQNIRVEKNKSGKLKAIINPDNSTNKNVIWTTSNKNVVSVDQDGNLEAKSNGIATIRVTTKDGSKTADCEIEVYTPSSGGC